MRVCVFCGSSVGARPEYQAAARELGQLLAARGMALVYGGASVGLMGALADAALTAGGEVIGVIPSALREREIAHPRLTDLRVVNTMHERKALMSELADAFIALPGGAGTLEELFEVWTWAQLGLHRKAIALLNVADFYRPLMAFLDQTVSEHFLHPQYRQMLLVADNPKELLDRLSTYEPPLVEKWLRRSQT